MENREHVVFLHETLAKKTMDKYLLNIALAYHDMGHKVTLMVSHGNPKEMIEEFEFLDKIDVQYCGSWIPRTFLGLCHRTMSTLKAAWMALRIVLSPPTQKPTLIVTDVHTIALFIVHSLSKYKIFHYENFRRLRAKEELCQHTCFMPTFHHAKFMKMANEVLVENSLFAEIFSRSFPALKKPLVVYRSIDIGSWDGPEVDIKRIIPDLEDNFVMLLTINKFKASSNFKLVMDVFEVLLSSIGDTQRSRNYHLVVAGTCKSPQEDLQYDQVVNSAKTRKCGSQMTILKTLPTIHEKSLIQNASVVICCARNIQADLYLKVLCLGKSIVATNRGIVTKIIKNRLTGILVEPEPTCMASEIARLIASPYVSTFMSEIAKDCFKELYSFKSLCRQLKNVSFRKK
ncbi:unnamed protein product [Ceutorhynchus assimilis]|uniref:Alpha-1,3/1,6-mannosyltransferase ALG2 n=1 Tax=Ceutorhynchus assimilis TaxID=467358 RepID=A0A9N9MFR8_9CUCU|nr:unnamed protein product [Ceutorhynchus assimilis]